ncbi:MAG: hypothetical protein U9Q17_03520, partial [Chloroflexota bacterium]|nr:hypothetical protein [Chloroflexota bacterium]
MMNLSCLLPLLQELPAYKQLARQFPSATAEHRIEIVDAAKPYFIAAFYQKLASPMVVITANPEDARKLYEQLQIWCPPSASLFRFPKLDFLASGQFPPPTSTALERLQVLAALTLHDSELGTPGHPPLIVASALASISKTTTAGDFASVCHTQAQGMSTDPLDLLRKWQEMGYEMEDTVEVPGTISHRGGIVDIFPVSSQSPYRIEFSGNQIESIRTFNPENQCSIKPVHSITITPARESVGTGNILDYLGSNYFVVLDVPEEIKP